MSYYDELDPMDKTLVEYAVDGQFDLIEKPYFTIERMFIDVKSDEVGLICADLGQYKGDCEVNPHRNGDRIDIDVRFPNILPTRDKLKETRDFVRSVADRYPGNIVGVALYYEGPGIEKKSDSSSVIDSLPPPKSSHWVHNTSAMDAQTLEMLVGGDLSRLETEKFEMNFVFYAPKKTKKKLIKDLQKMGWATWEDTQQQEDGTTYIEATMHNVTITEDWYVQIEETMVDLAEHHGAEYDGWFGTVET